MENNKQENKIDWKSLTSEEIFHKKGEIIRTYDFMKKMMIEMNDRMMELEEAFKEGTMELSKRGIE